MSEVSSGVASATNTSSQTPCEADVLDVLKNRNEYQRQIYNANKQKLLARRRQLYAESESRRNKDKEYYLKIKGTPEYQKRTAEASLRYYRKTHKAPTEEERRTRYRALGKLLADRHKTKGTTRVNRVDKSWMDSIKNLKDDIPDVSQPYGSVAYRGEQSQGVLALLAN